ncbi:hypothetical protein ACFFGH_27810 [Lysobacter korlensis]|uniref:Uncharacterized protein n=1 Tax=Lysobacter korlensis TaxID=553636 RepID=A0ABV6RYI0_9GAMM
MLDLLKSAQARRVLMVVTIISAITLLIVQGLAAWGLDEEKDLGRAALVTLQVVASGLFGGVAAAAFIAFVTRFLFRQDRKLEQTTVIDSLTSRHMHLAAIEESGFWLHNGHIGRWVRTEVLPRFAMAARSGAPKTVKFLLIDPRNNWLVKAYAAHRDQVDGNPHGIDTVIDARVEVLATILRAAHYQQHVAGVRVEVYLRSNLDLFRVDTSQNHAFVTLTRDKAPSIHFFHDAADGDHYWAAKLNFDHAQALADRVDLEVPLAIEPTEQDVESFLESLGFDAYAHLSKDVLARSHSPFNRTR